MHHIPRTSNFKIEPRSLDHVFPSHLSHLLASLISLAPSFIFHLASHLSSFICQVISLRTHLSSFKAHLPHLSCRISLSHVSHQARISSLASLSCSLSYSPPRLRVTTQTNHVGHVEMFLWMRIRLLLVHMKSLYQMYARPLMLFFNSIKFGILQRSRLGVGMSRRTRFVHEKIYMECK